MKSDCIYLQHFPNLPKSEQTAEKIEDRQSLSHLGEEKDKR